MEELEEVEKDDGEECRMERGRRRMHQVVVIYEKRKKKHLPLFYFQPMQSRQTNSGSHCENVSILICSLSKSWREQHPHAADPSFRAPRCEFSSDMNEPLSRPFNGTLCLGEERPFLALISPHKWLLHAEMALFPCCHLAFPFFNCTLGGNKGSTCSSTFNMAKYTGTRHRQSDACSHFILIPIQSSSALPESAAALSWC